MTAAMMTPLVLGQAHDLAVASLWRRRYRAVIGYLVGYLLAWTVLGAVTMLGCTSAPRTGRVARRRRLRSRGRGRRDRATTSDG